MDSSDTAIALSLTKSQKMGVRKGVSRVRHPSLGFGTRNWEN